VKDKFLATVSRGRNFVGCNGDCGGECIDCGCGNATLVQGVACDCPTSSRRAFFDLSRILDEGSPGWSSSGEVLPTNVQALLTGGEPSKEIFIDDTTSTGTGVLTGVTYDLVCCGVTVGTSFSAYATADGSDEARTIGGAPPRDPAKNHSDCVTSAGGCICGEISNCRPCGVVWRSLGTMEGDVRDETLEKGWKKFVRVLTDAIKDTLRDAVQEVGEDALKAFSKDFAENFAAGGWKAIGKEAAVAGAEAVGSLGAAIGKAALEAAIMAGVKYYVSLMEEANEVGAAIHPAKGELFVKLCYEKCVERSCGFLWRDKECVWESKSEWKLLGHPYLDAGWSENPERWYEYPKLAEMLATEFQAKGRSQ
jgi:hypothetical protein